MERYWCLRWLQQQNVIECEATILKEDLARLSNAPMIVRLAGLPSLERGQRITLHIMSIDELTLEMDCRFMASIESPPPEDLIETT
jgi:exoribonuclease-2